MKRPIIASLLLSVGLALPGCPIYDDGGCSEDAQCEPGYQCQLTTGTCISSNPEGRGQECFAPSDCRAGATCDHTGTCRSVDCSWADVGCVAGYYCTQDDGVWRCMPETGSGGSSSGGATSGGNSGAGEGGVSSGGMSSGAGGESAGAPGSGGQGGEPSGGAGGQSIGGVGGA